MKKITIIISCCAVLVGCSTKNPAFLNRAYHNTTARYNGYFNARESIKEGIFEYKQGVEPDYSQMTKLFFSPNEEDVSKLTPYMDKAIEKSSLVIDKHSMRIRGKEHCRWIDDNYMAVGMGHFYKMEYEKSIEIFEYVVKSYPDNPRKGEAMVWLYRSHMGKNDPSKAFLVISLLNEQRDLNKSQLKERAFANADYHIFNEAYEQAIPFVEEAIPLVKRKERISLHYLLGQLYTEIGKSEQAVSHFNVVAEKSPNYEMVFNARIAQAQSVDNKVTGYQVKVELINMLKDDKNIEYYDQIYYALAKISFTERNYDEAVNYLKKSTQVSTDNVRQKTLSFLKLAEYYFGEKEYELAGENYDSTMAYIQPKASNYNDVKEKQEKLNELIVQLKIIQLNDSLLALSELNPEEKRKKAVEIRKQLREEARQKAILALQNKNINPKPKTGTKPSGKSGSWYFYNQKSLALGRKEFSKTWGDRILEDHWRRKNKITDFSGGEKENELLSENNPDEVKIDESEIPTIEQLLADIPKNGEERNKLNKEIEAALYETGFVYKENFQDYDNSIEAFENLLARYHNTQFKLVAYYQLYRLYLKKESQENTSFFSFDTKSSSYYYKDLILYEFPESEFAALLRNPEKRVSEAGDESEIEKAYAKVFEQYKNQEYEAALNEIEELIKSGNAQSIGAKLHLLRALICAAQSNVNEFLDELNYVIINYQKTEEAEQAEDILDRFKNFNKEEKNNEETKEKKEAKITESGLDMSMFHTRVSGTQYYIISCPTNSGADIASLKTALTQFNQKYFGSNTLRVTNSFIKDNNNQILLIKSFKTKGESIKYYNAIEAHKEKELEPLVEANLKHFSITTKNFVELFKQNNIETYISFFQKEYLGN